MKTIIRIILILLFILPHTVSLAEGNNGLNLSEAEKLWLSNHRDISVIVNIGPHPLTIWDTKDDAPQASLTGKNNHIPLSNQEKQAAPLHTFQEHRPQAPPPRPKKTDAIPPRPPDHSVGHPPPHKAKGVHPPRPPQHRPGRPPHLGAEGPPPPLPPKNRARLPSPQGGIGSPTRKTTQVPELNPQVGQKKADLFALLQDVSAADQERFTGLAADYLKEIENILDVRFSVTKVSHNNIPAITDALSTGKIDLMPTIIVDEQRNPTQYRSEPYIEIPIVVITRPDSSYINDITQIEEKSVAAVQSIPMKLQKLAHTEKVLQNLQHASPQEGLLGVATGKYDAFIAELSAISTELSRNPVSNIKINGELPITLQFSMALSPQKAPFLPILNKALKTIPPKSKKEIWQKWFAIDYEKKPPQKNLLLPFIVICFVLLSGGLCVALYYRRRLHIIRGGLEALNPHLLCVHTDENITITDVTDALCKATGFDAEYLIGKPLQVLGAQGSKKTSTIDKIMDIVRKEQSWRGEIKLETKDGSALWTDMTVSPQRRKNETNIGYTVIYQDVTKQKKLENLAIHDELTGLRNRRSFNITSRQLLQRAASQKLIFSLFLLDVDNFKKYNDNYGHPAGDKVLQAIGKALKETLQRRDDHCFRLGGEEFGVISTFTSRDDALKMGEKILDTIRVLKIEHSFNPPGIITVSIGICSITGKQTATDSVIEKVYKLADKALYKAKEAGRNQFVSTKLMK